MIATIAPENVEWSSRLPVSIWVLWSLQNKKMPQDLDQTTTYCILQYLSSQWSLQSPYDHYNHYGHWERNEVYLSDHCRSDRYDLWKVVSLWSQQSPNLNMLATAAKKSGHKLCLFVVASSLKKLHKGEINICFHFYSASFFIKSLNANLELLGLVQQCFL